MKILLYLLVFLILYQDLNALICDHSFILYNKREIRKDVTNDNDIHCSQCIYRYIKVEDFFIAKGSCDDFNECQGEYFTKQMTLDAFQKNYFQNYGVTIIHPVFTKNGRNTYTVEFKCCQSDMCNQ